ncbi:hypothetical protein FKW77_001211 [Venturia effusa]|uniref:FAD-binding FR-type domain-containing protein n=1 Tax=Venturia effusa TaxID=50376 RepID=A0A517L8L1_9PEZI|nr:hypothetical protein FKW77_001211 [Venturia effusa]
MASVRESLPHEDRTVQEPRQNEIHPVVLSEIEQVNHDIKLFKLSILDREKGVKFHPGQWLDVLIPGLHKAGGFTLTSTPSLASPTHKSPYLELAVQRSNNPPAKWLWQPPPAILKSQLLVRVGGSFVWPPVDIDEREIEKIVFVAGGVGINPLISMLSHISATSTTPPPIQFLYSVRQSPPTTNGPSKILFYDRLQKIVSKHPDRVNLELFITGRQDEEGGEAEGNGEIGGAAPGVDQAVEKFHRGRITRQDLFLALGTKDTSILKKTACFVCGPPKMTDEIVAFLGGQGARVYCEKWW